MSVPMPDEQPRKRSWLSSLFREPDYEPVTKTCIRMIRQLGLKIDQDVMRDVQIASRSMMEKYEGHYIASSFLNSYSAWTVHEGLLKLGIAATSERDFSRAHLMLEASERLVSWPTSQLAIARLLEVEGRAYDAADWYSRALQSVAHRRWSIVINRFMDTFTDKLLLQMLDGEAAYLGLNSVDEIVDVGLDGLQRLHSKTIGIDEESESGAS